MKICLFGTYHKEYAKNASILAGLKELGISVVEIHYDIKKERMELPEDFSLLKSMRRILIKFRSWVFFLSKFKDIKTCDVIVLLHPGHLDVPVAWILSRVSSAKLIFDAGLSPYDTMVVGREMVPENSLKAKVLKFCEGLLLRIPDLLFVDTNLMKKFVVDTFGISEDKVFIVPLGTSNSLYTPANKPKSPRINVLFFGMYNPLHGAHHIMEAIKILKNDENIFFTMIGDGPLKEDLINFVEVNNLKNVEFIGRVPEIELVKYIQNSDILLGVFSDNKVMRKIIPNKIFGAMACKKPVITAKHPITEDVFKHKSQIYLVAPEDSQELANAIKELSYDPKLRDKIAEGGYGLYMSAHTPRQIAGSLLKVLSNQPISIYEKQ